MPEKTQTYLYLVPTPIGNLEDITLRALRILKEADVILAEDTRQTGRLLKHYQINTRMEPYHAFNEHKVISRLLERIKAGETFALVSDAGTPGISDPGFLLLREAVKENIRCEVLPGPVAFIPALLLSTLPADSFVFEGFLPVKKGRQTKLKELAEEKRTIVLYESPHRILKTLENIKEYFGPDREIAAVRELTKIFEETVRGNVNEVISHFSDNPPKGEFVLIVKGI